MKYKNLQILTIVSIIFGAIMFYQLQFILGTLGYMEVEVGEDYVYRDRVFQYEAVFGIWYAIVLTIIVFIIYPILYLRKVKKEITSDYKTNQKLIFFFFKIDVKMN